MPSKPVTVPLRQGGVEGRLFGALHAFVMSERKRYVLHPRLKTKSLVISVCDIVYIVGSSATLDT